MEYSATELKGSGSLNKTILEANQDYTFFLYRVPNQTGQSPNLSGSGYFTFETKRNSLGNYSGSTPYVANATLNPSVASNNTGSFGVKSLVSSSYIFSYDLYATTSSNAVAPFNQFTATSSFEFNPSTTVPLNSVYFRATGDYEMEVSPETQDCSIPQTYPGGQNYPTQLQSVLGSGTGTVTLTASPVNIPDRWIVEWDGNQVIDTGYISQNPTSYNTVSPISNNRAELTSSLEGKVAPEGGTYPLTPGGTAPNIILSDGYPQVGNIGTYTFNKNTSTSIANVNVYGPLPRTGWQSTLSCPV